MSNGAPLDLAFMGSGNAFAPSRCWSGFVLNERHLFDAPPTALYSLKLMGVKLDQIQTVFLSHFHADHFFGMPFLLLEFAYMTHRDDPLTIVGPAGTEDRLRQLLAIGYPSLVAKPPDYPLRFIEVEDHTEGDVNGLHYQAVEVEHGGEGLRCYGFRVTDHGRVVGYTGDSSLCPQLVELGQGADVLVTDCTYPSGHDNPEHMSFDEVKELHDILGGQTRLILTHLGGEPPAAACGGITVATDLARYHL
jgi:ribonuclease BN (tRNA processing enzyme)